MFQSFETGFGPFDPAAMSLFIALAVAAVFLVTAIRVLPQSRATAIAGIAAAAAILGWHALMERVSAANLIAATPDQIVPPTPFAIALPVLIALGFIFRSQNLRAFVAALPLPAVTAVQAYRMLGYTFIGLWAVGRLPGAFALPAGIGDLLVGGLALVAGWLALRRDDLGFAAVNAWNWFGAFDLVVAVSTGFLTSPGPYQLIALDRPNLLITSYPLSMVPLFAVPLSFILHAIVWMKLKDVAMVREDSDGAEVALT